MGRSFLRGKSLFIDIERRLVTLHHGSLPANRSHWLLLRAGRTFSRRFDNQTETGKVGKIVRSPWTAPQLLSFRHHFDKAGYGILIPAIIPRQQHSQFGSLCSGESTVQSRRCLRAR